MLYRTSWPGMWNLYYVLTLGAINVTVRTRDRVVVLAPAIQLGERVPQVPCLLLAPAYSSPSFIDA